MCKIKTEYVFPFVKSQEYSLRALCVLFEIVLLKPLAVGISVEEI